MALSVTDAFHVQRLLLWIFRTAPDKDEKNDELAIAAAAYLADRANKTLMAGLDGDRVLVKWARANPSVLHNTSLPAPNPRRKRK